MFYCLVIGYEVDVFGGVRVQNDFVWVFDIEEFGNGIVYCFIFFGCEVGQVMQFMVYIGVFFGIVMCDCINYYLWFLC